MFSFDIHLLAICFVWVILSHLGLVYDCQFSSVTIYKVCKCVMPSALKSVHILKVM